jgi:hypothetical protein
MPDLHDIIFYKNAISTGLLGTGRVIKLRQDESPNLQKIAFFYLVKHCQEVPLFILSGGKKC